MIPTLSLQPHLHLPLVGLGTWRLQGQECVDTIKKALQLGYRHIDTAHVYNNHEAIREGIVGFDRKELFLTSKLSSSSN